MTFRTTASPALVLLTVVLALVACSAPGPGTGDGGDASPDPTPGATGGGTVNTPGDTGGGQGPDDPVVGRPGASGAQPGDDGALVVQPEPGIVDPQPHAWDHITVAADGRTITVFYWGGVQECYGLAAVHVDRDADGLLEVTVLEGRRADLAPDTACIEIAVLKSVTVDLDEPIIAPAD
ncbi:MAG: hypothetical protein M3N29_03835 [Chloroflexota bacterium]|nr:hypothetical protein [Chloroflexota bacterium]